VLDVCHPEELFFWRRRIYAFACGGYAADKSIGPSARKKRVPQDDKEKGTTEAVPFIPFVFLCVSVPPWWIRS
jgi:hypothetical protein